MFQIQLDQNGGTSNQAVCSTENMSGAGVVPYPDNGYPASSPQCISSSLPPNASSFMSLSGSRIGSSIDQDEIPGPNGQVANYEVVNQRYRGRPSVGRLSSSSAYPLPGSSPPGHVKRHGSAMIGQDEESDYAQLNRCIPTSTSTLHENSVGTKVKNNRGKMWGRKKKRGQSASALQVSSYSHTYAGSDRQNARHKSVPNKEDDYTIMPGVNGIYNAPSDEPEDPPPSYRDLNICDSSMMDNDAYEAATVKTEKRAQHRVLRSTESLGITGLEPTGEKIDELWYRRNASDASLNIPEQRPRAMTTSALEPYSQISNMDIDAQNHTAERERVSPRLPSPYAYPVSTIKVAKPTVSNGHLV